MHLIHATFSKLLTYIFVENINVNFVSGTGYIAEYPRGVHKLVSSGAYDLMGVECEYSRGMLACCSGIWGRVKYCIGQHKPEALRYNLKIFIRLNGLN